MEAVTLTDLKCKYKPYIMQCASAPVETHNADFEMKKQLPQFL